MKKERRKQAAADWDLPLSMALDLAEMTLYGHDRLVVLNHKGMVVYLPERIVFRTAEGEAQVLGSHLSLSSYCAEELVIEGDIRAVYPAPAARDGETSGAQGA